MKTPKVSNLSKNIFLGIATAIAIFSLSSCAKKVTFLTSSIVPAARGSVKVSKDRNKNYVIKIQLYNLAESNRLQPSKSIYVVWMAADHKTINLGKIKSSTSALSNKLKAYFENVSSVKPDRIFITAEDDANIQYPSSDVVLSTDNF